LCKWDKKISPLPFLTCVNTSCESRLTTQQLEKDLETAKTMDDLPGKNGVIKKLIEHLTE